MRRITAALTAAAASAAIAGGLVAVAQPAEASGAIAVVWAVGDTQFTVSGTAYNYQRAMLIPVESSRQEGVFDVDFVTAPAGHPFQGWRRLAIDSSGHAYWRWQGCYWVGEAHSMPVGGGTFAVNVSDNSSCR